MYRRKLVDEVAGVLAAPYVGLYDGDAFRHIVPQADCFLRRVLHIDIGLYGISYNFSNLVTETVSLGGIPDERKHDPKPPKSQTSNRSKGSSAGYEENSVGSIQYFSALILLIADAL